MGESRSLVEIIYSNIISFHRGPTGRTLGEGFPAFKVQLLRRINIVPYIFER